MHNLTALNGKKQDVISGETCINHGDMVEFSGNHIDEMVFREQKKSEYMLWLAKKIGFSHFGLLQTEALDFKQEVRDMCASGRCGSYGKRWTCPPHCGTLEESVTKAQKFNSGIILQMTGNMDDDFDVECMQKTEQTLKDKFDAFVECLQGNSIECLPMSAGTCTRCSECTCPDEPCRFSDKAYVSMEAYGLIVSDICIASGVGYHYGPRTITFTTCVLFNET